MSEPRRRVFRNIGVLIRLFVGVEVGISLPVALKIAARVEIGVIDLM